MIAIVSACGANFASIQFALQRLGYSSKLTTDPAEIQNAAHVILPGVGSAAAVMQKLQHLQLIPVLQELQQPVLGICLGMQILFTHSAEGAVECLKILPGKVLPLTKAKGISIPHMGWNRVAICKEDPLFENIVNNSYFYFVHSYAAHTSENTLATATYSDTFSAAVRYKNFYGVQFHPERSGCVGETILENFLRLT